MSIRTKNAVTTLTTRSPTRGIHDAKTYGAISPSGLEAKRPAEHPRGRPTAQVCKAQELPGALPGHPAAPQSVFSRRARSRWHGTRPGQLDSNQDDEHPSAALTVLPRSMGHLAGRPARDPAEAADAASFWPVHPDSHPEHGHGRKVRQETPIAVPVGHLAVQADGRGCGEQ